MPGKLRRLPGRKGRYYRRKDGKYRYKGQRYSRYHGHRDARIRASKSAIRGMSAKRARHYRLYYPHAGDARVRRKTRYGRGYGWF